MADKKKSGKFFTTILIGGALGSLAAWLFGNKKRRDVIAEKAQEYYENTKGKIDDVLKKPEKREGLWSRLFGRDDS
jgi:gas vesicle protein